jgi:uncharacterized protein YwgA
MLTRNIILLALNVFGNKAQEETMLQNRLYFLDKLFANASGIDLNFQHNSFYCGPYSEKILNDITKLVNYRLVREEISGESYRGVRSEFLSSFYELTSAAEQALRWIEEQHKEEAEKIKELARIIDETVEQMNDKNLSVAATTHWVLKATGEEMTAQSVAREAKRFCSNITDAEIDRVLEFLRKIGLSEPSKDKSIGLANRGQREVRPPEDCSVGLSDDLFPSRSH